MAGKNQAAAVPRLGRPARSARPAEVAGRETAGPAIPDFDRLIHERIRLQAKIISALAGEEAARYVAYL